MSYLQILLHVAWEHLHGLQPPPGAASAHAEAEAATLQNVKDRCLRAEAAWLVMAERQDRIDRETLRLQWANFPQPAVTEPRPWRAPAP